MQPKIVRTVVAASLAAWACVALASPAAADPSPVPHWDHIVMVIDENKPDIDIVGNPDAPYITSLANEGAHFTQFFAETHPSEPNYLALFSGSTQGLTDDSCPHSYATPNLGDSLAAGGVGFTGYSEDLPSVGYTGCTSGKYARKHNPWVDFPSIPASANQPFSAFPSDYSTLPPMSIVVPNLNDDMHDGTIAQGDSWLQTNLDSYVTWAKTHNSLFVLTFDEDDGHNGNRIPTIAVGARVAPGMYDDQLNHYNLLRTITDSFGVTAPGAAATASPIVDAWTPPSGDEPPTAAFTSSCTDADCTFDASGSSDPDGSITDYQWDFGDGSTGSGVSLAHTYAAGGTYTVRLAVVDDLGATGTVSHQVTVSSAAGVTYAADAFGRSVSNGWGNADVGGAWTVLQSPSAFSVGQGVGAVRLGAATTARISLAATGTDTDLTLDIDASAVPVGGAINERVLLRSVSKGNDYDVRVNLNTNGKVGLSIVKFVGGKETALTTAATVPGVTAAMPMRLHAQALGSNPTTLKARLWPAASAEPTTWNASATDSTAALAGAGSLGINSFLSSAATNAPITLAFDNLVAATPGSGPPPNQPPTAAFTSSCTQLTCTFDGTGSSDPDGTIAGYAWDFNDGATADTGTVTHTFPAAGSYDVELVVTDNVGAQDEVEHDVDVSSSVTPFASDSFARTVSNGWGSADAGGAWSITGTKSNYTVASGSGRMRLAANGFDAAYLPASSAGTDLTLQLACSAVPTGGAMSVLVIARRVSAGNQYAARIYVNTNRTVTVQLLRQVGGTETTLSAVTTVPGLTATAGVPFAVRLDATGAGPTTLRAKVWTGSEPSSWLVSATDSTAALQAVGSIGITSYLSNKATASVTLLISALQAVSA